MVWPNGKVAHVDCYNRARLELRRPQQTQLGAGGAL
jgi:hypothetical protein